VSLCFSQDFEGVAVDYLSMPGWKIGIAECKKLSDISKNAKKYIQKAEELVGVPGTTYLCDMLYEENTLSKLANWDVNKSIS
jgi:adenylosuccinate synthase